MNLRCVEETLSQFTVVRMNDEPFFQSINQSVKTGPNSKEGGSAEETSTHQ